MWERNLVLFLWDRVASQASAPPSPLDGNSRINEIRNACAWETPFGRKKKRKTKDSKRQTEDNKRRTKDKKRKTKDNKRRTKDKKGKTKLRVVSLSENKDEGDYVCSCDW